MVLVQLHFSKILAEKGKLTTKEYKVKQDLLIQKIDLKKLGNTEYIVLDFRVNVEYTPNFAMFSLEGSAVFTETEAGMKIIRETYEKKKKLPGKWGIDAMNLVMMRAHLKVLQLTQDIGVPPHIQLPLYSPGAKKTSDYIG